MTKEIEDLKSAIENMPPSPVTAKRFSISFGGNNDKGHPVFLEIKTIEEDGTEKKWWDIPGPNSYDANYGAVVAHQLAALGMIEDLTGLGKASLMASVKNKHGK